MGCLGWLDFGARMYDSYLGRWISSDPLMEKYPELSPYEYCSDDPVNVMDPEGKDIAVLVVDGQHIALLIQNNDNQWAYYSINGDNVYFCGKHTGGRPFDDLGEMLFDSPRAFLESSYNRDIGDAGKGDKTVANYDYVSAFIIKTDDAHEQDAIIADEFKRISLEEDYRLFPENHCGTTVQRSLLKGGIETRQISIIGSPTGVTYTGMRFPYLPSEAYKQIKTNNNGHEIIKQ